MLSMVPRAHLKYGAWYELTPREAVVAVGGRVSLQQELGG